MTRNITDFNTGSQLIAHFAQMFAVGFKVPLIGTLLLFSWLTWFQLQSSLGDDQFVLIAMKLYAAAWRFMEFDPHKLVTLKSAFGGPFQIAISRVEDFPSVVRAWHALTSILFRSAWLSVAIAVPVIAAYAWIATRFGRNSKARKHQRGRRLVSTRELLRQVKKLNRTRRADELRRLLGRSWRFASAKELAESGLDFQPFTLAGIPWPWREEQTHAMLVGSTGTGKTVALMDVLDQVRERGNRSVVFDLTGAYVETYYDPARDTILHPLDARCPRWSIFDECSNPAEFMAAAEALIPSDGGGEGQFWVHGARMLFTNMCNSLVEYDMATNEHLASKLMTADVETVYQFVKDTPAAAMSSPDSPKLADSVRAVFNANAQALLYLPKEGPQFSIRNWIREGKQDGAILFISARSVDLPVCRQLLTLWLNSAVNTLMAEKPTRKLRMWFVIDELGALHRLPALEAGMRTARNFGGAFVTGVHTQAKLREVYGIEAAHELSSLAKTKLILGNPDPDTAKWCSEVIGNGEVLDVNTGYSFGYSSNRDSVSLSPEKREVRAVMPEEVGDLDPLHGFICLPGSLPPAPVHLAIKQRCEVSVGFIPRRDFELVRGSKTYRGPRGDAATDDDDVDEEAAGDESGKGAEARPAGAKEHALDRPRMLDQSGASERSRQGMLDLSQGLQHPANGPANEPADRPAVGATGSAQDPLGDHSRSDPELPTAEDKTAADLAKQTGESRGKEPSHSGAQKRNEAAAKRSVQRRAAVQREIDGSSEPEKDRGPDLGDFGPG
jgi:type IV conjugative transfer system coupling protein TraD